MNMKTLLLLILVGPLISCAPDSHVVEIMAFSSLGSPCVAKSDFQIIQAAGTLDISAGQSPNLPAFYVQINFETYVATPPVQVAGRIIAEENRDRVVIDGYHLTYTIQKGRGVVKTLSAVDDVPLLAVYTGSAKGFGGLNLIGPKGGAALFNEVPVAVNGTPTADDVAQLKVGVRLDGYMSGQGNRVSSGTVWFPIRVVQSNNCANGYLPPNQCPFPGQDGYAVCAP